MTKEKEDENRFKVTDRRSITEDGEIIEGREETKDSANRPPRAEEAGGRRVQAASDPDQKMPPRSGPPMDFASFLLSLATTAMMHLGELPDPVEGTSRENLEAARQMVDILSILQEKSEGNRTVEEDQLLEDLLYELRMKYLAKAKVIEF